MNLSDFEFPLVEAFRGITRAELARQKLLTGVASVRVNNANYITLDESEIVYIHYPSFNISNGTFKISSIKLKSLIDNCFSIDRVHDFLYKFDGMNLYFIIIDNKIRAVFKIHSFIKFSVFSVRRDSEFLRIIFEDKDRAVLYLLSYYIRDYGFRFNKIT